MAKKKKNPIEEAYRYLNNAREILREKAGKEDGYYQDKKYVKMAGHTAYCGVLEALDSVLAPKQKGRLSVQWYQETLGDMDRSALRHFNSAYNYLHLLMGYDGDLNAKTAIVAFEEAEYLVKWAAQKLGADFQKQGS